jgi:hypothetical protein
MTLSARRTAQIKCAYLTASNEERQEHLETTAITSQSPSVGAYASGYASVWCTANASVRK